MYTKNKYLVNFLVFTVFGFARASHVVPNIVNNASEQAIRFLNARMQADGSVHRFNNEDGRIIFSSTFPPQWANKIVLEQLDLNPDYGTSSLSPFKVYTDMEMKRTEIWRYMYVHKGYEWIGNTNETLGLDYLKEIRQKIGKDAFKDMHAWVERKAEEAEKWALEKEKSKHYWNNFFKNIIPRMLSIKVLGLGIILVLICIGIPVFLWHFSKAISNYFFKKIPVIIGPNDSNVYARGFLRRLMYRWPRLPNVIVPSTLSSQLKRMVIRDRAITKHNKNKKNKLKKKYTHSMSYGVAGVGKTLFAKKYAQQAGMNFIYFSVADLSQMNEEECLQELKSIIAYAYRIWPCVLIIDEADQMFKKGDLKAQKMKTLFQKEFSKGVNSKIKIFYITNYPNRFPSTILGRIGEVFFFPKPELSIQKQLFSEHLKLAVGKRFDAEGLVSFLTLSDCEGLVGRDIEIICSTFSMEDEKTFEVLRSVIEDYRVRKEEMKKFEMPDEKREKQPESRAPEPKSEKEKGEPPETWSEYFFGS